MAKKSRRPVRATTSTSSTSPSASPTGEPQTPASEDRAARRARPRRVKQQTFLEKYRTLIIAGAAGIGVLIIGLVFFQGASTAAYSCGVPPAQSPVLLTPGPVESLTPQPSVLPTATPAVTPAPTSTPAPSVTPAPSTDASPGASSSPAASPSAEPTPTPEPTPRLGFTTEINGGQHVASGTPVNYPFCPPTSGNHYNDPPRGPISAQFYGPAEAKSPAGWIHNLEHGFIVLLYRCPSGVPGVGDCPTQEEMDQMRAWFEQAPPPHVASCPKKVLVARFDSMDTQFGELAWGRALLTDDFDLDTALTFAQQWMEHDSVPENAAC